MKQTILITMLTAGLALLTACEPAANTNTAVVNANKTTNSNMTANSNSMNSNAMSSDNSAASGENPMVGGAAMSKDMDIIENASKSKDHTTLVSAVKAAGLVETLQGDGPFTVFAPTNAAFDKLPKEAVADLLKPENKEKLAAVLKYHVVAGKQDAASIVKMIKDGNGKAMVKTVNGDQLTASLDGEKVILTDSSGGKSTVTTADVMQSNGVIHVVDSVLMPK